MLDKIREGVHGTAAKIVLGLIILSFALAGVGSYVGGNNQQPAAIVNGEEISPQAFEAAYQNERARMEQQFGQLFGQLASDTAYMQRFRASVLERMVDERLTDQAAKALGLRVSDDQIKDTIMSMPQFQVNGVFSNDVYLSVVRRQGMTTAQFREYMRQEMTRRQLLEALVATDFVTKAELEQRYALDNQSRDIRFVTVDQASFMAQVEPSEEQLQQLYQERKASLVTPEQVALEYIQLDAADLAKAESVSDDEIAVYYEENAALFKVAEKRKVAHILLPEDATDKADELRSQLVEGADFAALASANSIDTFSAENGGELDWFERGTYGEEFDAAAFELAKVGDISAVVETESGVHLIKLLDIQPASQQPLADVKADIAQQLKKQKADSEFAVLQSVLTNAAFEVPDTLVDAAKATGLEVKSTELFSRTTAKAPFDNPELLNAAFSDTVMHEGLNSDPIELGNEKVMIVRLKEHKPSQQQSFEEVKPQLEAQVRRRLAGEKAEELAAQITELLVKGEDVVSLLESNNLAFEEKLGVTRFGTDVAPAIRDTAFSLIPATADAVSAEQSVMPGGKYAVVELLQVNEAAKPGEAELQALASQMTPQLMEQSYQPVIEMLRERAEIRYLATNSSVQ